MNRYAVFKSNAIFGNRRKIEHGRGRPQERVGQFYKSEEWKNCKTSPNEISILEIKDK